MHRCSTGQGVIIIIVTLCQKIAERLLINAASD